VVARDNSVAAEGAGLLAVGGHGARSSNGGWRVRAATEVPAVATVGGHCPGPTGLCPAQPDFVWMGLSVQNR
jgi:hypothetical protein